jgi:hypothetical protein
VQETTLREVLAQEVSSTVPIQDMPTQVEMVATDASPGADGVHTDGAEPQPSDAIGGDALAPTPMGG